MVSQKVVVEAQTDRMTEFRIERDGERICGAMVWGATPNLARWMSTKIDAALKDIIWVREDLENG